VLRAWVKKYGIPVALYTDWKNVYVREASTKEQLQGVVSVTQFGQMCQRLRIGIIAANSPQAKGRVERNHGTHQDRLVKKMRLKKIKSHAEANTFLEKEYLPEHNRRFRRTPAQPEDYHRPTPRAAELEEVFHLETGRVIGNDWVVRHDNRYFQVQAQARQYAPAKGKVTVCEGRMGDYGFAIAAGRWLGRRFQAQFQRRRKAPGRPRPRNQSRPRRKRITPGGRTIARCARGASQGRCRGSRKCPVEIAHEMCAWQAAEKMAARKAVEKTRSAKVKRRLSHSAWKSRKPRGIPTFPQPR
jgi:hypothetical protein